LIRKINGWEIFEAELLQLSLDYGVPQNWLMTRKDSDKDSERPHYYSQFWLDVAAGRRVIGAPKTNDDTDMLEADSDLEPEILRKPGRNSGTAFSDGYQETISHPEVEPEYEEEEEFVEPEPDELELEDELDDEDIPNIVVEETEIPDMDLAVEEEAPVEDILAEEVPIEETEDEDFYEDEDEDDLNWTAGRGRKKPKPGQAAKLPAKKAKKREPRRGF
jgi:hypothetical protein